MTQLIALVRGKTVRRSIRPGQVLLLGRHRDCEVVVNDNRTSRRHAELFWPESAKAPLVRDKGSSNGTFVDGQKISGDTVLRDGAMITLGDAKGEPVILEYRGSMVEGMQDAGSGVILDATAIYARDEGEDEDTDVLDGSDRPTEGWSRSDLL